MKTATLPLGNLMNRSPLRAFLLIALALGWLTLSPQSRAVCEEGCLTDFNTVLGEDALLNNTTGANNTATGFNALFSNTTGSHNTAIGLVALETNTTGNFNTAIGYLALSNNTRGSNNTATGVSALFFNTTGSGNTATGAFALNLNTTGNNNVAVGEYALHDNTDGNSNTAIGVDALLNNNGDNNIALGKSAGANLTTGSNNIYIGSPGDSAGESNKIRIGTAGTQSRTFIAGISGVSVPAGVGVIVGTDGKLGTAVSSARFKDEIKPMDKASEAILALKPVTFHCSGHARCGSPSCPARTSFPAG
jgi:hypothetical protein